MVNDSKIGFIGAGNMAYGMVKALTRGFVDSKQIFVSAPSNRNLPKFVELGCNVTHNSQELLPGGKDHCSVIFLCVKPNVLRKSLDDNKPFLSWSARSDNLILISILAGMKLKDVARSVSCPDMKDVAVYRIMTNTACALGEANCAIVKDESSTGDTSNDDLVKQLTTTFGSAEFIPEYLMDAFGGLAGSGIAFAYTMIQAMADGGVKMGIPRQQAQQFAAQTISGACKMVLETGKHPFELRDAVCSPGGTTICGIHAMERAAVSSGIIDAVEAATLKAKELG